MCLLITQFENSPILDEDYLIDFYHYNPDGIGVMYEKNKRLIIKKLLPRSPLEIVDFYKSHIQGKACAFHLRMRTHGDIDISNCHPYEVLNESDHGIDLYLMHNGILRTGNSKDTSKSDTYHFIQDHLKPLLVEDPNYAFTDEFISIVGNEIGNSNKFVLMDNLGRQSIINANRGIFWQERWFSNTYAWTPPTELLRQRY